MLRFLQQENKGDEVTVARVFDGDFLLLFGLLQRVRHLARCHMVLTKQGYGSVGRMLVRAAIEHAVTAHWVFFTQGGVDRLRVAIARDQLELALALGSEDQEHLTALSEAIPYGKGLPKWTDIMRESDDPANFLKQSYRVLSQTAHVTHATAADAFSLSDSGELSLVMRPEDQLEHEVLYALAGSCMLSAWLFAVMAEDKDEQVRLISWSRDLSIPWTISGNLPAEKRRNFQDVSPPVGDWFP